MVVTTEIKMPDFEDVDKVNVLTDRVRKRREAYLSAKPRICSERGRLATESWRETEGEPVVIRRAKLFKRVLEGIPVVIRDGELVVGSQTKYVRGAYPYGDFSSGVVLEQIEAERPTTSSEVVEAELSEEDRRSIREDVLFWKGRSASDKMLEAWRKVFGSLIEDLQRACIMGSWHGLPPTSRDIDFEKVLKKGLVGAIEEAREELQKLTRFDTKEEVDKFHFLEAAIIALEAVITYAHRHAQHARELVQREGDAKRKRELEKIAEMCEWAPKNPARSFHEAVQSFWLLFLALNQETASQGETPGRFDQYMYPFYERDIREGRLTRQEAAEILSCLWVKFLEMEMVKETTLRSKTQGSHLMNLTIGGVDKNGEDATNELSYLILEVVRQIKPHQPHLTVRYHDGLPEAFLIKAVETNRDVHGGMPQWVNDKIVILNIVALGVPLEEARDWEAISCSYFNLPHAAGQLGKPVQLNMAKIFELALNNGIDPRTGKRLGVETGDPRFFSSWEEVYEAFKKQVRYMVETIAKAGRLGTAVRAQHYAMPFNSALMDDCIKTGKDVLQGGMRYTELACTASDRGHVDVANSLAAIKKAVFEEKRMSMAELLDALHSDFEGKEEFRQTLLSAPKWGNDDDYIDSIMKDVWLWTAKTINSDTNIWGKPLTTGRFGIAYHYWAGKAVGALPSGRKAYTPLTDGAISPTAGTDKKGPTAVINSCSKLDYTVVIDAVLNQKFPPAILQTRDGIRKLLALVKTFFDRYGYHVQFNIVDRKTLLDAQRHPELYRDLVIRVAGYSAYFVELAKDLQDEIIARTEHTL